MVPDNTAVESSQPAKPNPPKVESTIPLEPTTYSSLAEQDEDDELFRELEEEDDDGLSAAFRERRMEQLNAEVSRMRQLEQEKHGRYETVYTEKEILHITTTTDRCIVHFSHKDFRRCQLMDRHMEDLAKKHVKTRFIKIDVADAPFLVEKLKIQILPCIMAFVGGITVDKLLGFEGVSEKDDFPTSALEKRLSEGSEVIVLESTANRGSANQRRTILGFSNTKSGNHSDSDDSD
ncbi:hypothetical protein BASA83_005559 [Batrachochytrium salamandrivorans]|nr:hypothetical protein BASA81_011595 [Batrachochytrium salamandrivorans]KAH9272217.1 hypothetical protein BASA83_005559 [Batrachochytrium salamandrivorans]